MDFAGICAVIAFLWISRFLFMITKANMDKLSDSSLSILAASSNRTSSLTKQLSAAHSHVEVINEMQVSPASHLQPRTMIGVVSSCLVSPKYGSEFSRQSLLNKQEYCDRHEDVTCYLYNVSLDERFSAHWNKFPLLSKALEHNDFATWMDCDAIFIDMAVTFEETGLFRTTKEITFTADHNGINTGVFAVRKSEWTLTFLSLMYAQRGSVDYFNSIGKGSGFVDQQGLKILQERYYTKDEFANHSDTEPKFTEILNNYCVPGRFIHHRVNCNSEECDRYFICLIREVRSANESIDKEACAPPQHLRNLCEKQRKCCFRQN